MQYAEIKKDKALPLSKLKNTTLDDRYICSKDGRIFKVHRIGNRSYLCVPLKPYVDRQGYVEYVLTDIDGKKKHVLIHRVVAELFIPNRVKARTQVNHIDGNKQNNDVNNLEWLTPSENIIHMHRMYAAKRSMQMTIKKEKSNS